MKSMGACQRHIMLSARAVLLSRDLADGLVADRECKAGQRGPFSATTSRCGFAQARFEMMMQPVGHGPLERLFVG
jgi:hypothetical protein